MSTTEIKGLDMRAALVAIVTHWTAQGGSKAELCRRAALQPTYLSRLVHHGTHEPSGGLVEDVAKAAGVGVKVILTLPGTARAG